MLFEERQNLPRAWSLVSVLPGLILIWVALTGGAIPLSSVIAAAIFTIVVGSWMRSIALLTSVTDDHVTLRYRGLFKTRTVPISSIREARARTYRPVREFSSKYRHA